MFPAAFDLRTGRATRDIAKSVTVRVTICNMSNIPDKFGAKDRYHVLFGVASWGTRRPSNVRRSLNPLPAAQIGGGDNKDKRLTFFSGEEGV